MAKAASRELNYPTVSRSAPTSWLPLAAPCLHSHPHNHGPSLRLSKTRPSSPSTPAGRLVLRHAQRRASTHAPLSPRSPAHPNHSLQEHAPQQNAIEAFEQAERTIKNELVKLRCVARHGVPHIDSALTRLVLRSTSFTHHLPTTCITLSPHRATSSGHSELEGSTGTRTSRACSRGRPRIRSRTTSSLGGT